MPDQCLGVGAVEFQPYSAHGVFWAAFILMGFSGGQQHQLISVQRICSAAVGEGALAGENAEYFAIAGICTSLHFKQPGQNALDSGAVDPIEVGGLYGFKGRDKVIIMKLQLSVTAKYI